jgi:Fibronectin type III domain
VAWRNSPGIKAALVLAADGLAILAPAITLMYYARLFTHSAGIALLAVASPHPPPSIQVVWSPPLQSVIGYEVFWGPSPRCYTNHVSVGMSTNATLSGLDPGAWYYISVRSLSGSGVETNFSNEVRARPSTWIPAAKRRRFEQRRQAL